MINMKRFKVIDEDLMRPYEQPHGIVPDEVFVEVVLAADAEAAIAGAFQAGMDQMIRMALEAIQDAYKRGTERGQRDMLSKCIAAVEVVPHGGGGADYPLFRDRVLIALRALEEKP